MGGVGKGRRGEREGGERVVDGGDGVEGRRSGGWGGGKEGEGLERLVEGGGEGRWYLIFMLSNYDYCSKTATPSAATLFPVILEGYQLPYQLIFFPYYVDSH